MLDLSADRVVEACVIVGIAWRDPALYFPALILVATWYVNITIFLAVGAALEGPSAKLIEYPPGILERTEAIIFFIVLGVDRSDADPAPDRPATLLRDGRAGNRHRSPTPACLACECCAVNENETVSQKVARIPADRAPVLSPPIAARKSYQVTSPNGSREDDYYWLRDDTRKSKDVLDYLKAENAYTADVLAPTHALQDELYKELVGRIKQDDASVPVLRRGWWYYTRYETGREYPIYARRRRSMSAPEQVMLDGNALAAGKAFFQIGAWAVSPNGRLLAYAEDIVGRRQYTLRVKDLHTGAMLADSVD